MCFGHYGFNLKHTDTLIHCTHDYFIHATKCSMYTYHIMHKKNGAFDWEKCAEWSQNDLKQVQDQKVFIWLLYKYLRHKFHPFHFTTSGLSYDTFFRKVHRMTPKWPRHVAVQKYQHACYIKPRGTKFCPFNSTMSQFWVMKQFVKNASNNPKIILTCSRLKVPICIQNTPPRPKFSSVMLYDELPFLRPFLQKRASNDPI